ncbi:MAG: YbaK/EbsC family protein, partial [Clostridia bacterium]|nr:YbaK/EbsC family protein [Clostridia bacterium]
MSLELVRNHLKEYGLDDRIREFDVSSATVELAAAALGTEGARIAKTISVYGKEGGCLLIVTAGDTKIDNAKFKARFG